LPAYARTGLTAFFRRRLQPVVIQANGRRHTLDTLLVAVANSDQYGNGARIAPGARIDDGQLDLVAVQPVGFGSALPLVARLFLGSFHRSPRVLHLRSHRFVIERRAPDLIHTDGETHATGAAVEIAVHPRSLRLLVPAARGPRVHAALPAQSNPAACEPRRLIGHTTPSPLFQAVGSFSP
ncbi:MAG TPA: hypothetical protein VEA63_08015, partial [Opitutus sp.]|nr:hypothetical protein [Opitutus sp.]